MGSAHDGDGKRLDSVDHVEGAERDLGGRCGQRERGEPPH